MSRTTVRPTSTAATGFSVLRLLCRRMTSAFRASRSQRIALADSPCDLWRYRISYSRAGRFTIPSPFLQSEEREEHPGLSTSTPDNRKLHLRHAQGHRSQDYQNQKRDSCRLNISLILDSIEQEWNDRRGWRLDSTPLA
ncbi:hypothetical protein EJ03DRAFT_48543 [Teratosphaeria nubilosa]|uniref:Uncharacterized protein n=1 Tax=Teratosphaeria nubilosa TaxID=161662 RepID=A0A6G1KV62_9PEZI|nr:hypothetical protein EJ03DRAFT_48543 [Teratosphaeria nubilosa]